MTVHADESRMALLTQSGVLAALDQWFVRNRVLMKLGMLEADVDVQLMLACERMVLIAATAVEAMEVGKLLRPEAEAGKSTGPEDDPAHPVRQSP